MSLNHFKSEQQRTIESWIRIRIKKQLDPDPHWEEQLDPDPQKMNADPQPWYHHMTLILNEVLNFHRWLWQKLNLIYILYETWNYCRFKIILFSPTFLWYLKVRYRYGTKFSTKNSICRFLIHKHFYYIKNDTEKNMCAHCLAEEKRSSNT